ncbi:cupin domain-containing protein [Streptomyces sp. NPDC005480]|uniref:cupin domain-containing protein n=1 Tax=Streptomyces sp. NPDC005480 TaxID=3154880 RepID=UPI00339FD0ED
MPHAPARRLEVGAEGRLRQERRPQEPRERCRSIRAGRVILTTDDGTSHTFSVGDAFTIAAGWPGDYRVDEPLLKQFAFYTLDHTATSSTLRPREALHPTPA